MRNWLSEEVLSWLPDFNGGHKPDASLVKRPHEILTHAQTLAGTGTTEFALADSVSNLKRAINVRLRHLEELYGLARRFPKSIGALERLEAIGLARPFLIRQLFELRNDIEHNDALPPNRSRCLELVDIAWYFLKTTDNACRTVPQGVFLRSAIDNYATPPPLGVTVELKSEVADSVVVFGWVSLAMLAEDEREGYLPIELRACKVKETFRSESLDPIATAAFLTNSLRSDDERWIEGVLSTPPRVQHRLYRLALETL